MAPHGSRGGHAAIVVATASVASGHRRLVKMPSPCCVSCCRPFVPRDKPRTGPAQYDLVDKPWKAALTAGGRHGDSRATGELLALIPKKGRPLELATASQLRGRSRSASALGTPASGKLCGVARSAIATALAWRAAAPCEHLHQCSALLCTASTSSRTSPCGSAASGGPGGDKSLQRRSAHHDLRDLSITKLSVRCLARRLQGAWRSVRMLPHAPPIA